MMKVIAIAIASLPILANAMAIGVANGQADTSLRGEQHLDARRAPIYPTRVTVRARAPIYPTRVTVRARRDDIPSETTAINGVAGKGGLQAMTLRAVGHKGEDNEGGCPARSAVAPTTVCPRLLYRVPVAFHTVFVHV